MLEYRSLNHRVVVARLLERGDGLADVAVASVRLANISMTEIAGDDVVTDSEVHICAVTQFADGIGYFLISAFKCLGDHWYNCTVGQQPIDQSPRYRRDLIHDGPRMATRLRGVLVGHQPQHLVVV